MSDYQKRLEAMRSVSKGPPALAPQGLTMFIVKAPRPGLGEGADIMGAFSDRDKAEALVDYLNDQDNEHYSPGADFEEIDLNHDYLGVLKLLRFKSD